jgi:hypothetical protein
MDTFQFSDSYVMLTLFLYHSVASLSFMDARCLYPRRSFACCRDFGIGRCRTDSVVNASSLAQDPIGHTTKTVIIASIPVAGIRKVRGFQLELSSASPDLIYSVTNAVE